MTSGLDPRTPVLVGVGQVNVPGTEAPEPTHLLAEAARLAGTDSGSDRVVGAIDSIQVVRLLSWRYQDPGALVGELLGVSPAHTAYSTVGGQTPQSLVHRVAASIVAGDFDVVLVGGAESWRARNSARAAGAAPDWTKQADDVQPTETVGAELSMGGDVELSMGLVMPPQVYPLFEVALRAAAGRTPQAHLEHISELWARFSQVAATNPHAALQAPVTAEAIRTTGPGNRWIGYPYPKLMNANNAVNQAAALLLCSVEKAEALGIPRDRWVFLHAGTESADTTSISERASFHSSPAIRLAGERLFELAGAGPDDLAHVDVYSCFPSAVEVAAQELGLDLERPLTVTGGLTFAGGPWNNYVSHSIAAMVGTLRQDPGSLGLVTANGGLLTKHALGIYSTEPPAGGLPRIESVQAAVDALPTRQAVMGHEGPATVETYTVMHDRDGAPEVSYVACLLDDGRRAWGTSRDTDVMAALMADELVGAGAKLHADGGIEVVGT